MLTRGYAPSASWQTQSLRRLAIESAAADIERPDHVLAHKSDDGVASEISPLELVASIVSLDERGQSACERSAGFSAMAASRFCRSSVR
jgi:hypothetical protein